MTAVAEDLFHLVYLGLFTMRSEMQKVYRACKHEMRILLLMYEEKRPEALFYYSVNMLC